MQAEPSDTGFSPYLDLQTDVIELKIATVRDKVFVMDLTESCASGSQADLS
jgi:hypothetical protein